MKHTFEWIGGSRRTGEILVSMSPRLNRIVIYRKAFDLIQEKTGQDLEFVKLGITSKHPGAFWIKPCAGREEGALKIHSMGNTRMISAKKLFDRLEKEGWIPSRGRTQQFPVEWDDANKALRVDLSSAEGQQLALEPQA